MTKTCATYDDVDLVIRLYKLRREEKLREAREWFASSFEAKTVKDFNELCPAGSEENGLFLAVVTYWELAASFITADVLHAELFFETAGELFLVWERIKEIVPLLRKSRQDPMVLRNLEKVAAQYAAWLEKNSARSNPAAAVRKR